MIGGPTVDTEPASDLTQRWPHGAALRFWSSRDLIGPDVTGVAALSGEAGLERQLHRFRPTFHGGDQVHPVSELGKIAREFRHLKAQRSNESPEGSWRRQHAARMDELEQSFETLVQRWVPDADEQARWHAHFHRGDEDPEEFEADEPPLFRGRSELGGVLVVRVDNDEQKLLLDGAEVARWPMRHTIAAPLRYDGSMFFEEFQASPAAQDALSDYLNRRVDSPPWSWARELYDDGLIDSNFGLTPRGRRFHERRGAEPTR